jgi:hypothetical protein
MPRMLTYHNRDAKGWQNIVFKIGTLALRYIFMFAFSVVGPSLVDRTLRVDVKLVVFVGRLLSTVSLCLSTRGLVPYGKYKGIQSTST